MSSRLRQALLDLGDVAPPPDLAGRALAHAGRTRRRTATVLAVVLAVLVGVAVPVLAAAHRAPAPTAAVPPRPVVLQYQLDSGDPATTLLPDGYGTSPYDYTYPSPDGRLALVFDWPPKLADTRYGIVPLSRIDDPDAVRWSRTGFLGRSFVWSADSRRLWVVGQQNVLEDPDEPGVARTTVTGYVMDVAALVPHKLTIAVTGPPAQSSITFGPNQDGVALALAAGRTGTGSVDLFDERGRRTGSVPVRELTDMPDQPFSPDRTQVLVTTDSQARVLDLASGAVRSIAAGSAAGWYDDGSYLVMSGRAVERVEAGTGRLLGRWDVAPPGTKLSKVWVGRVGGSLPPGAVVLGGA